MGGICSEHREDDPACPRCRAGRLPPLAAVETGSDDPVRAVIINGRLTPLEADGHIAIDPATGTNAKAYTYRVVGLEDLTTEERAMIKMRRIR